ncbi:hypothetical protein DL98DRAFT_532939 [Cadophora sp. DSE1049]|nr:hypothetical protein DL98DRAFT_532939 [Cadophora sp. DSE1049]
MAGAKLSAAALQRDFDSPGLHPSTGLLEAFSLFPKFPLDVRFMIYDLLIAYPRAIEICSISNINPSDNHKTSISAVRAGAPPIIQVNRETPAMCRKKFDQPFLKALGSPTHVNFEVDLLHFEMTIDELVLADTVGVREHEEPFLPMLYSKLRYCVCKMSREWPLRYLNGFKSLKLMVLSPNYNRDRRSQPSSSRKRADMNEKIARQKEAGEVKKTMASTIVDFDILEEHCAALLG